MLCSIAKLLYPWSSTVLLVSTEMSPGSDKHSLDRTIPLLVSKINWRNNKDGDQNFAKPVASSSGTCTSGLLCTITGHVDHFSSQGFVELNDDP